MALGFLFGIAVLALAAPTGRTLVIGMAIAAAGEAIRVWAAGHLNKAREVTRSGPYRWIAHPLYTGSTIMGIGLGIACHSVTVAALIALYVLATFGAAIRSEEAFLQRRFGDQYERYKRGQGGGSNAVAVAPGRRFSVGQALANREHRAVIGLIVAMLLLFLKGTYTGSIAAP